MSGDNDQAFRVLIERRRNRAIKSILGVKEALCDVHLPPEVSEQLRRVVLEELNDLTDVALTVLASQEQRLSDGAVYNELWLEKLEQIHAATVTGIVPDPGMRPGSVVAGRG